MSYGFCCRCYLFFSSDTFSYVKQRITMIIILQVPMYKYIYPFNPNRALYIPQWSYRTSSFHILRELYPRNPEGTYNELFNYIIFRKASGFFLGRRCTLHFLNIFSEIHSLYNCISNCIIKLINVTGINSCLLNFYMFHILTSRPRDCPG